MKSGLELEQKQIPNRPVYIYIYINSISDTGVVQWYSGSPTQSLRVHSAVLYECHQGTSHHPNIRQELDMADETEAALANRTYVQAAAVKAIHIAHHWLSERPGFRSCVCQRRSHSNVVRLQLQRARQTVVCPYAGARAEYA